MSLKQLQDTIDRPLESFLSNKEDFLNNTDKAFQEEKDKKALDEEVDDSYDGRELEEDELVKIED